MTSPREKSSQAIDPKKMMRVTLLFGSPGIPQLIVFSGIGRLGFGLLPLAMLLAVAELTSSYGQAGLCTGVFALTSAGLAPARARLNDRRGPVLSVGVSGLVCGAALVIIAIMESPAPALLATMAGIAGALAPPFGPATKARLAESTANAGEEGGGLRQLAFSLDTAIDITALTAGPLAAGTLNTVTSPQLALTIAGGLVILGAAGMSATQYRGESRHEQAADHSPSDTSDRRALLRVPVILSTWLSMIALGTAIGAVEVDIPAFSQQNHQSGAAGFILAILFGASGLGGLVYGRITWRWDLRRRYQIIVAAFTVSLLPVSFAGNSVTFAALVVLPGLFLGPALISAYLIAENAAGSARRTEAIAWINTANNAGTAVGMAAGGIVIDHASHMVTILSAALVALLGLVSTLKIRAGARGG